MNSCTKIWVIPKKAVIAAAGIIIAAIIALMVFFISYSNEDVPVSDTGASVASDTSVSPKSYVPGVYTSSISLDNTPMSVKVTVDADNINSIDLIYTDEAVTTMYPMLGTCFNELAKEVCDKGSTKNINYDANNRYTAAVILNGIENALSKAYINAD